MAAEMAKPAPRPVARGALRHNHLDAEPEFYAFVADVEGGERDDWDVTLELVGRAWVDRAWGHLLETGAADEAIRALDGREFAEVWPELSDDARRRLFFVYYWFVRATLGEEEEWLGAAPVGLFGFTLKVGDPLRRGLRECLWYTVDLEPAGDDAEAPHVGTHLVIGATWEQDERTARRIVPASFERVPAFTAKGRIMQSGLHALHFPQADPGPGEAESPPGGEGRTPDPDGPDEPPPTGFPFERERLPWMDGPPPIPVVARLAAAWEVAAARVADAGRQLLERLVSVLDAGVVPGAGLRPAFAGGAVAPPGRPRPSLAPSAPLFYVGSPATNTGNAGNNPWNGQPHVANQAVNPMIRTGATVPFVGALDVGQGSCNMLCDAADHVFAYFDFGYPTGLHGGSAAPAAEPLPCLCHEPLIIISHWDYDHWGLSRRNPNSYRLQWIVPQQHMGTTTIHECVARVLVNGGQMHLWMADGPTGCHMRFPWGYVERLSGPNAMRADRRNTTGLVAYVCVRDQKGGDANQTAAVAYDHSAGAPNVALLNGANAAGLAAILVAAPAPANWPGNFNWAPFQTEAQNHQAGIAAGRASAAVVPAVAGAAARKKEAAALVAICARAEFGHAGAGAVTAQHCADVCSEAVDAYAALRLAGTPRNVVNATGQIGLAAGGPAAMANAGPVPTHYALQVGLHSDLAEQHGEGTDARLRRICRAAALGLIQRVGNAHDAMGEVGIDIGDEDENRMSDAQKRAELAGALAGMVRTAVHPLPAQNHPNRIPYVVGGQPPYSSNERYVLVTGDADFGLIPSQHRAVPPVVVGLVAAHHGAKQMDNRQLTAAQIPFAPGSRVSRAARAARAAHVAPHPIGRVARDAGNPLVVAGVPGGIAQAAALARANALGKAAEEMIDQLPALVFNYFTADAERSQALAAAAAAAVAVHSIYPSLNAVLYPAPVRAIAEAVAPALAYEYHDAVHPLSLAWAALVAARHSEATINAAMAPDFTLHYRAVTAASTALDAEVTAGTWWAVPSISAAAWKAGEAALYASQSANPNFTAPLFAQGRPTGGQASYALDQSDRVQVLIENLRHLAAGALALNHIGGPAVGLAAPGAALTWREWAAKYGAEAGVALVYQVDAGKLRTATEAAFADRAPAAVPGGQTLAEGVVAYSYGISGGAHCHLANPGPHGHPHPFALQKYLAKGWSRRRNTPDTTASRQPDPSPWGAIAMGWEDDAVVGAGVYEGALRPAAAQVNGFNVHDWTCNTCPAQIASLVI